MTPQELNALPLPEASRVLLGCCTSERWVEGMVSARPFADRAALLSAADQIWESLSEADYLQAFEGHPKIGNIDSLRERYSATRGLSASEQAGMDEASEEDIQALAAGNRDYEARFGFIFIVCASGKTATQMLSLLRERLGNTRDTELQLAAQEQQKIFQLRLEKLL